VLPLVVNVMVLSTIVTPVVKSVLAAVAVRVVPLLGSPTAVNVVSGQTTMLWIGLSHFHW
jgi:hypothetical protein